MSWEKQLVRVLKEMGLVDGFARQVVGIVAEHRQQAYMEGVKDRTDKRGDPKFTLSGQIAGKPTGTVSFNDFEEAEEFCEKIKPGLSVGDYLRLERTEVVWSHWERANATSQDDESCQTCGTCSGQDCCRT